MCWIHVIKEAREFNIITQLLLRRATEMVRAGKAETKSIHVIEMEHSPLVRTKQENRNGSFKHFPVQKLS